LKDGSELAVSDNVQYSVLSMTFSNSIPYLSEIEQSAAELL